ncbi:ABC transporter ATP-binding protein [Acidibrevibacterium fodinaquatile]|uniref:ABC transporter ATP-binding protein n=1 Tax=Acidibrevibacterium fodinaquatile TaxID=1969806 RepID=UPI000E0D4DFF|nr:ABC transporter ATP-binding protein [Acidibrevibacterium fodinaquatile]
MANAVALLRTEALSVRFGGEVAVDHVSAAFYPGTLTAIVGPNGAGKTTFFNLISGQIRASAGEVWLKGERITRLSVPQRARRGLGRAFQLTNLFPGLSVFENIRLAVQAEARRDFRLLSLASDHHDLNARSAELLETVGLSKRASAPASALSHGDQRKLEVALLLAGRPDVFMFDEPTAGMSVDEVPPVLDLIAAIKRDREKTILLVEHKMDVIRALADRVIVLHQGRLVADGVPEAVMALAVVQEAYLGSTGSEG